MQFREMTDGVYMRDVRGFRYEKAGQILGYLLVISLAVMLMAGIWYATAQNIEAQRTPEAVEQARADLLRDYSGSVVGYEK